ncbi:MAG TPA: transaldolase [Oligoflexia bacterium]|nr:transaldolase [Oligoflexia bacterium]HMP47474.1 transaldolase [Oligoflexia bacterium]
MTNNSTGSNNPSGAILEQGQSIWYDNISRELITSGSLSKMLSSYGVRGMTSNPSIFDAALKKGNSYDGQVASLANQGLSTQDLFNEIALQDIAWAADLLLPIYHESKTLDGYVSLEVSPLLARDAEGTIKEAEILNSRLNRPNVMIKIPGTKECLPAIKACLEMGININVTLLFSVDNYVSVAETYCEALRNRLKAGKPVRSVRSVASFFVSRVDTNVDAAIAVIENKEPRAGELKSKFGIANCKLAYEQFKRIFLGDSFSDLRAAGAFVQRPLWASTSTKSASLKDTIYVEELIGPDTVNTMPHVTLEATLDHGNIRGNTIEEGLSEAHQLKSQLVELGVDIPAILEELQVDGVKKFAESFDSLLSSVEAKRVALK